jgi:hypothetical protein
MTFDTIDRKFRQTAPPMVCVCCLSTEGVALEPSRTAYHFEGERGSPDDPNRPVPLCRPCAEEYHAYWDERWAEYYAGRY